MENKINIAELLKDCPEGMELDCTTWENVTLEKVVGEAIYIKRNNKGPSFDKIVILNKYGCTTGHQDEKCRIFPKDKTTWEGFVPPIEFKDGDVIFTHANCLNVGLGNTWISIYKENRNGGVATYIDYAEDGSNFYSDLDGDKAFLCMERDILRQRIATEEEKEKLFQAIKANGYKWNSDTKILEKLIEPKFKVGNKIVNIHRKYLHCDSASGKISQITDDKYIFTDGSYISISNQDNWELVPNKFDITTLKPFDKVLARCSTLDKWCIQFFEKYDKTYQHPFICMGYNKYKQCIPYEGNEHLHNTTNECDDFYKTWEK